MEYARPKYTQLRKFEYLQEKAFKHQNHVNDVVLVFLLLALNIEHISQHLLVFLLLTLIK